MLCEHCGSPIDREEAEGGLCTHCGAILPHVLRAAEKAEIVRRVVKQGHDVRIEGDRIEARASSAKEPVGQARTAWGLYLGVIAATGLGLAMSTFQLITHTRSSTSAPPLALHHSDPIERDPVSDIAPMATSAIPEEPISRSDHNPGAPPGASAKPARVSSVDAVVQTHKAQFDRCQRAEIAQNPSAARRYSVAITVGSGGRAEWVEVLSEASPSMKACIDSITKELAFPKPSAGSTRAIFTLSFTEKP